MTVLPVIRSVLLDAVRDPFIEYGVPTPASGSASPNLWLVPEEGVTESSGSVSAWASKSPGTINFSQAVGGSQPSIGTRTINGQTALDFVAVKHFNLNAALGGSSDTYTIFMVLDADRITNDLVVLLGKLSPGAYLPMAQDGNATPQTSNPAASFTPSFWVNGVVQSPTTRDDAYEMLAPGSGPIIFSMTFAHPELVDIFGLGPSGFAYDGAVGEIIGVNATLSTADWNLWGRYLSDKYGIGWTDA